MRHRADIPPVVIAFYNHVQCIVRRAVKQRESKQVMDRIRNNDLQTEFLLKVGKCLRIPLFMQEQEHIPFIQKGM